MRAKCHRGALSTRKTQALMVGVSLVTSLFQATSAYALESEALQLKLTPATRYFVRFGAAVLSPKVKAGDVQDASGPLIPANVQTVLKNNKPLIKPYFAQANIAALTLGPTMAQDGNTVGIGTPPGASMQVKGMAATPLLMLGMYLDDASKWSVETILGGLPLQLKIYGAGIIGPGPDLTVTNLSGDQLQVPANDLGLVSTVKVLPVPTAIFMRHFGDQNAVFRPAMGMYFGYNVFLSAKDTASLAAYVGGPTKIKVKNAFSYGPIFGADYRLNERWSLTAQLGYEFCSTSANLITQTNTAAIGASKVFNNIPPGPNGQNNAATYAQGAQGTTQATALLKALAVINTGDPNNIGAYTRTVKLKPDAWLALVTMTYKF